MFRPIKKFFANIKRRIVHSKCKSRIPVLNVIEKIPAMPLGELKKKRGTFSITPSLEIYLDYHETIEHLWLYDNEYIEEFAGLEELRTEPEMYVYTITEFFELHSHNVDYYIEPFIEEDQDQIYGAFSVLADFD